MHDITRSVSQTKQIIAQIAVASHRNSSSISLLAVSKTQPSSALRLAYAAGQRLFGENYLQEALKKIDELADLNIEWHFIGPLQSNKTQSIAENFCWVHSVDRLKIARRLSSQRPTNLPPLNICLQINIDDEESKSGVSAAELPKLAKEISALANIRLRGLMAIPSPATDSSHAFRRMKRLLTDLQGLLPNYPGIDTLSMGMSKDMEAAIAEGATIVRIGTGIFGERPQQRY